MFPRFVNKNLIIILFIFILLIIVIGLTIDHRDLTWPEKIIKDTTSWVQELFYIPSTAVIGFFEDTQEYRVIFEENKVLKYNLNQYAQVVAETNQLKEENRRLKEMLEYKEDNIDEFQLVVAKVISRSPDKWNNMLVIDKGINDGIKKDMAVVNTSGFVGKVYSVSNYSSNVQLITDNEHNSFVFALIQSEPKTYGIVKGYDKVKNLLRVEQVGLDVEIIPGQLVTTSSLGGVFPTGLVIGEVSYAEEDGKGGLTKIVYVKPAADLYHLDEVFVIKETLEQVENIEDKVLEEEE
ncbi:MAG: rod shape-determining protein MreC [Vulcanibacillus sp.]